MPKPQVAIIGRVNVGKSTLFNRLIGRKKAVVEETPGVTRDRLYGDVEHEGHRFLLVDTGGLIGAEDDPLLREVTRHAELALEEADVVVLLVDAREGLVGPDHDIAELIRKSGKPYVFAANKMESPRHDAEDFLALRLGAPLEISALQGYNVSLLLDEVVARLPPEKAEPSDELDAIRVAVVGRPNVGKSLLVNAIAGEDRVIVSELPGTTRDAVDVVCQRDGQQFVLVDTAGLRKKSKVKANLEYYSVVRSLRAIDRCDVALLVLDAAEGVADQDTKIGGYAHEQGRAGIIVANKWDLVQAAARQEAEEQPSGRRKASRKRIERVMRKDFETQTRRYLSFMDYAPLVFTSALHRNGIELLLDHVVAGAEEHSHRVGTGELNRALIRATKSHTPPTRGGRQLRIYYATQAEVCPPTIVLFVNDPKLMHFSYERYLRNALRKEFGFQGTPIRLSLKPRREARREARARRAK
ncbi:MAG: ribosome biogenesis GTPase Der [Armatimonadota bacterium]